MKSGGRRDQDLGGTTLIVTFNTSMRPLVRERTLVGHAGVLANPRNGFARRNLFCQKSLNVSAHDERPLVLQEQRRQGEQVRRSLIAHGIIVSHVSREFDVRIREYGGVLRLLSGVDACGAAAVAFMAAGDPELPGQLHLWVDRGQELGQVLQGTEAKRV